MGNSIVYCCLWCNATEEPVVFNKNKRIHAKVLRVVDGDTFDCQFYYGIQLIRMKIRIYGLDTPEKRSKNTIEKQAGKKVSEYANKYLEEHGNMVQICIKDWDKYGGRMVAEMWVNGMNWSEHLVSKRFAKPYTGDKKEEWLLHELEYINNC